MIVFGKDGEDLAWICDVESIDVEEGRLNDGDTVSCLGTFEYDRLDYPLTDHITATNIFDEPEEFVLDDRCWYLRWDEELEEIYQNALQEKRPGNAPEGSKEYKIKGRLV